MKKSIVCVVLLTIGYAAVASAECELSSTIESNAVPPEKLALRGAVYQDQCKKHDGELVDSEDTAMKARLKFAVEQFHQDFTVDEQLSGLIQSSRKPAVLAIVVEPGGRVSWVGLLDSSGNKQLDKFAMELTGRMRFGSITLDGKPVRVFSTLAQFGSKTR